MTRAPTRCRECSSPTMVIIKDYSLKFKSESGFFKVRSFEQVPCPVCEEELTVYGSRKRVLFCQDGTRKTLVIRRLRCGRCESIHHELPDIVAPYKRYESEAVESVLASSGQESANKFPGELRTYQRLKMWFYLVHSHIEGALRALKEQMQLESVVRLPLFPLHRQVDGWLKHLVRHLVNSGRWLQTCSA